jgi:hypothetical protein
MTAIIMAQLNGAANENPERNSMREGRNSGKSFRRPINAEGRSTDVTTLTTGTTGDYSKKSAMEIAFGKIKGIMEELKDTNQQITPCN